MESKEAQQKLLEIFGNRLKFNREFDNYIVKIKDSMIHDLLNGVTVVKKTRSSDLCRLENSSKKLHEKK